MDGLLTEIRACTLCEGLPLGPAPLIQASTKSRILIAGQAPGRITHAKGIPFDDPSGNRLRDWLGVDRETFYDPEKFAIVPMGFCFPGTGKSGDLPPRPECVTAWRAQVLGQMANIKLTLIMGLHAQEWHLGTRRKKTLTATVQAWEGFWPDMLPLPHPSPRNMRWFKQNKWFDEDILPMLKTTVAKILD